MSYEFRVLRSVNLTPLPGYIIMTPASGITTFLVNYYNFTRKINDQEKLTGSFLSVDESKAAGYDSIPARLIHAVDYICEPLTHNNLSITTGISPKDLKIARVIPIYKKGIKFSPGNYRPISILPVILSKVFEN